jgi:hypothetical protein
MNRRRLLTVNYQWPDGEHWELTHIEPIYNDIGVRRKRGRHGEDGEKHENKCEGIGDSEVHVCVIETEYPFGSFYRIIHRVREVQHTDKV